MSRTSAERGQRPWQRWIGTLADGLFEAARLGVGRVKYLAYYMSSSELRAFVRHSHNKGNLLARRMVALGLDPYEAALSDPALVRHLQRTILDGVAQSAYFDRLQLSEE